MVTGVSSPPSMTNLRGRTLAATRTPLTASGSAPGSAVPIARTVARSGWNSAPLRPPAPAPSALALITSGGTQRSLAPPSSPAMTPVLLRRHLVRRRYAARLHHHLDGVLDAVLGVADRGRQVVERE